MLNQSKNLSAGGTDNKKTTSPLLKSYLKINIAAIILPLLFLGLVGFFFFQKLSHAFDYAIDDIVSDIVPIIELKDKIQLSIIPFNQYLDSFEADDKEKFLQSSNEIKQSLIDTISLGHKDDSLANDLYRSAYLSWRNVHRIAIIIFNDTNSVKHLIPHYSLYDFYQSVIETTLILDQLHLKMQDRSKINFHKAKEVKSELFLLIIYIVLFVYIITLSSILYLNRSILKPVTILEKWAENRSGSIKVKPLTLQSYKEFEFIAATYNKLSQIIKDKETFLEQLTQKDNLTKLYNKRYFIKRLVDEHHRHQRYNTHYCLMLIDVDHIGAVSRNYGDAVGELTLIQIARLLEEAIRPTDFLAHYESDRFIIILPEVEIHGANMTAERIINSISETVFNINEFKFGITVSVGFSFAQEDLNLSGVLQCVDYSLQQAKLSGRNQFQYCESDNNLPFKFKSKYLKDSDFNIS
ncbi:MAG: GGDEF domain-containing protein [gamma proteobacterium symbiont of Taylorina sp.]|nr:GGDEF domain-containing protein [gamma proteobacterium symbiont of Taylorina sp.]